MRDNAYIRIVLHKKEINRYYMKSRLLFLCLAAMALAQCVQSGPAKPVYLDESKDIEARVADALSRMTTEEKIALTHAQSKFSSAGVPRLGIPEVWCTDGPHGIRAEVLWDEWDQAGWTSDSCTAFPALTCLSATWNKTLAYQYGQSIGEEARYRKKDVLLGPGVNIMRTPLNGRNFEYLGEDPFLSATMVVPYVKGVQTNGVAACVKHFALNSQEVARTNSNSIVDERALNEIYLPAFKAAVEEGGTWAIMGSYNQFKNHFCCHNDTLLNKILKDQWGFDGVVISDWGGAHITDEAIAGGLDMEFGSWTDGLHWGQTNAYDNYYLAHPYLERIRSGKVSTKELDDKATRILRLIFRTNMNPEHHTGRFVCDEHYAVARKIGAEGIVLLKNEDNILPVNVEGKKILVVGENAVKMMTVGGGSSSLKARKEVSPLDGLREAGANVVFERGYIGDASGAYNGVVTGQDLGDSRTPEQLIADAVAAARNADIVIFIGGLNKSDHQDAEGSDRLQLDLPYGQQAVIEALAQANANLIAVNISGSPVAMPWAPCAKAIVQDWYVGSEAGNSLADVLTGKVNPSGKLPFTVPYSMDDSPIRTERQYPGIKRDGDEPFYDVYYDEGIYVGYRWYEHENIAPQFPFGYGLSYTTFDYGAVTLSKKTLKSNATLKVTVEITNTGDKAGAEVAQLYVAALNSGVDRPVKELKGFDKVYLEPGQSTKVTFSLSKKDLSYYDASSCSWVADDGEYEIRIGASSADIRANAKFRYQN